MFVTTAARMSDSIVLVGGIRVWQGLLCDDAEKTDHSAVLAGAPAINSRRFQELQESNTPNSVPSKLGCRCITYLDLGS